MSPSPKKIILPQPKPPKPAPPAPSEKAPPATKKPARGRYTIDR